MVTYRRKAFESVPHHNRLLVDRVNDDIGEEIDGMAADFAMLRIV